MTATAEKREQLRAAITQGLPRADALLLMLGYADGLPDPIVNAAPKPDRNAPCPCGSGVKFKQYCGRAVQSQVPNPKSLIPASRAQPC